MTTVSELLPDEIQESVHSLNGLNVPIVVQRTVPAAFARLDDDHDDDADKHGYQGGHHVVDHCAHAHLSGRTAVQRGDACRRGNQRENLMRLLHVQILLSIFNL